MADVKELIDQYAAENQGLKQQAEMLFMLLRDITVMHQDAKGVVRLSQKNRNHSNNYQLEIKQLKTSVVLKIEKKAKEE